MNLTIEELTDICKSFDIPRWPYHANRKLVWHSSSKTSSPFSTLSLENTTMEKLTKGKTPTKSNEAPKTGFYVIQNEETVKKIKRKHENTEDKPSLPSFSDLVKQLDVNEKSNKPDDFKRFKSMGHPFVSNK
eukprot:gene8779-727_t